MAAERGDPDGVDARADADDPVGVVLDIWRTLTSAPELQPEENVFERGADSVAAVQATLHIRARLGHELSVIDIFDHPTAAGLGSLLRGRTDGRP